MADSGDRDDWEPPPAPARCETCWHHLAFCTCQAALEAEMAAVASRVILEEQGHPATQPSGILERPCCGASTSVTWADGTHGRIACRRSDGHEGRHFAHVTSPDGSRYEVSWGVFPVNRSEGL